VQIEFSGQTILVTGASRGIGAAIARRLARAGARVIVHYVRAEAEAEALVDELGGGAFTIRADLSDPVGSIELWTKAQVRCGRIDGLVNNAGIAIESPLGARTRDWLGDWERTMAVNATAPGLLSRAAIQHFEKTGGGRLVTIASRAAFRGDQPEYLAYAASKAAVVALTRSIARGFGKAGIKAFAVAPGFTRTAMAQAFIDQHGEDHVMGDIALDRLTEPDDIAPTVAFLLSGLADHATGATIDLNAASYVH
jgi:NAD(P)-dependent dehydrogenase (short-subunit alcohol dehydrogenase family)